MGEAGAGARPALASVDGADPAAPHPLLHDAPVLAVVTDADLLGLVQTRLGPHLQRIIDDFYDRLGRDAEVREVVSRLTADQFEHLKRSQVEHLRLLLSPHLEEETLTRVSREVGRIHAMVGVGIDAYTAAVADHRRGVTAAVSRHCPDLDPARVQALVTDRFMGDLHGALLGFRDLDEAHGRALLHVLRVLSDSRTVADLSRGLVDALGALPGMSVCLFARADQDGVMQYEVGGGPGFDRFVAVALQGGHAPVTTSASEDTGLGPIGHSWRTGEIRCCHSWHTDPSMAPWRGFAVAMGWAASASVPLVDRRGRTRALLSLQASWAGYFSSPGAAAMLAQVKQAAEQALVDLEERPTLSSSVSAHVDRTAHLSALAAGDVEMLFQPLVGLGCGHLHRVEALARLRNEHGLVSPAEFLPAFGDDELFELFRVGLDQSLTALRGWQAAGLSTDLSVNLPVVAVDDGRYVQLVETLLRRHDVDPGRLTLELLETGFVDREMRRRLHFFDELKTLGVRLAQDDLGSGYSSLLRLRHFDFDEVKIDQSLVRGTELAPGAALHFIQPINDLAHSQGLSVVIEGLEDRGLIEAAVQLGVDEGQGYGIARPMPADDLADWAGSFRLEVEPDRPRTRLGALAGHVAWQRRQAALAEQGGSGTGLDLAGCRLTRYLADEGTGAMLAAHEEAHRAAVGTRDNAGRREAYERLAALLSED